MSFDMHAADFYKNHHNFHSQGYKNSHETHSSRAKQFFRLLKLSKTEIYHGKDMK